MSPLPQNIPKMSFKKEKHTKSIVSSGPDQSLISE